MSDPPAKYAKQTQSLFRAREELARAKKDQIRVQLRLFFHCKTHGPIAYPDVVQHWRNKTHCKFCNRKAANRANRRSGEYLYIYFKQLGYSNKEIRAIFKKHRTLEERSRYYFNICNSRGTISKDHATLDEVTDKDTHEHIEEQ